MDYTDFWLNYMMARNLAEARKHLTHPSTGADLGEIAEVSLEGTYDDSCHFYYVWVKD